MSEKENWLLVTSSTHPALAAYAGRWVALVHGHIAGVGRSAEEARRAAHASRHKEKPEIHFVLANDWQNNPLLRRVWRIVQRQDAEALLVGGAVRDGLLGRPLHDLDFAVEGNATALAETISRAFRAPLVRLDPQRDIARVVIHHAGQRFDLDFARRQEKDWASDLRARDFTINAVAVDAAGRYRDPLNGRQDLAQAQLRATHASTFRADPLRTLRAVRLVAELDFDIEPETAEWIRRDAGLLTRVAAERVRDEVARILGARGAAHHLARMEELDLLAPVLPEVEEMREVQQSAPHQWDVWNHTRMTLEALEGILHYVEQGQEAPVSPELGTPGWVWGDLQKHLGPLRVDLQAHLGQTLSDERGRRLALKLAALLHDAGKPLTRSVSADGRIRFYSHEGLSAELTQERLQALRFSSSEVVLVQTIVAHHMRPGHLARTKGPSRRAIYRYFKATGPAGVEIGLLSLADMLGAWGPALPGRRWLRRLTMVTTLLGTYLEQTDVVAPPPLVNGHDLMAVLDLPPGPEIGRLLEAIREAQAAGEVKTRQAALELAARLRRA
jgi:tRNA nucleotidyltransferase/poly(A) polymerase